MSDSMSKIADDEKEYRMLCTFWGIAFDPKNLYLNEHSLRKLREAYLNTAEEYRTQFTKDYYAKGNR